MAAKQGIATAIAVWLLVPALAWSQDAGPRSAEAAADSAKTKLEEARRLDPRWDDDDRELDPEVKEQVQGAKADLVEALSNAPSFMPELHLELARCLVSLDDAIAATAELHALTDFASARLESPATASLLSAIEALRTRMNRRFARVKLVLYRTETIRGERVRTATLLPSDIQSVTIDGVRLVLEWTRIDEPSETLREIYVTPGERVVRVTYAIGTSEERPIEVAAGKRWGIPLPWSSFKAPARPSLHRATYARARGGPIERPAPPPYPVERLWVGLPLLIGGTAAGASSAWFLASGELEDTADEIGAALGLAGGAGAFLLGVIYLGADLNAGAPPVARVSPLLSAGFAGVRVGF